jgi:hypothetical protein
LCPRDIIHVPRSVNGISVLVLSLELPTLYGPQHILPEGAVYRRFARDPLRSYNVAVPPPPQYA